MKRLTAILAAITMLAAVSCSSSGKVNLPTEQTSQANGAAASPQMQTGSLDTSSTISYKKISLPLPLNMDSCGTMTTDGTYFYIYAMNENDNYSIWKTDSDFDSYTEIELREINKKSFFIPCLTDGRLYTLVTEVSYKGLPEPDYDDPDFDWEEYQEAIEYSYTIEGYDKNGEIDSSVIVSGLDDKYYTGEAVVQSFMANSDGSFIIIFGDTIVMIASDGTVTNSVKYTDMYIGSAGFDSNGNILCFAYENNENACLLTIDRVSGAIITNTSIDANWISNIIPGRGEYTAYMGINDGIYAFNGSTLTKQLDYKGTGIENTKSFELFGDDGFFITAGRMDDEFDSDKLEPRIYKVLPLSEQEMSDVEVIRVYGSGLYEESLDIVENFNAEYEGKYRIDTDTSYLNQYRVSLGHDGKDGAEETIMKAIMADDAPDLIWGGCHDFFMNLAAKDCLADLYPMLESDPDISKSDFLPNLLPLCENKGKLAFLPYQFSIMTIAAKDKWIGNAGQNWTGEQMLNAVENLPDGMSLDYRVKEPEGILWDYVFHTTGRYIDYDKRTCSFDSPEFISMLELMKSVPSVQHEEDYGAYLSEEELLAKSEYKRKAPGRDEQFLVPDIGTYEDYCELNDIFAGDPFTLVGYPSSDGTGGSIYFSACFAILENSKVKEGAWEFMKYFYTDQYQSTVPDRESSIGTGISVLDKYNQYSDQTFNEYIRSIKKAATFDYDIFDIIEEEIGPYLNGEKTAEQTAEIIQSRVSIVISEQY